MVFDPHTPRPKGERVAWTRGMLSYFKSLDEPTDEILELYVGKGPRIGRTPYCALGDSCNSHFCMECTGLRNLFITGATAEVRDEFNRRIDEINRPFLDRLRKELVSIK